MTELEEDTLKIRAPRRRVRAAEPSKMEVVERETPEEKAAREAKLAAERAMRNAILLIQVHDRARVGRCQAADGNSLTKRM